MSVSKLSEQMVKAGCEIQVFTTAANGSHELPVALNTPINVDGVNVTYFKRITKDHSHLSPALLVKLWQQVKNFDIVHIHAWWNLVSVFSCAIALIRGVKVVISPRGTLSAYSFNNKSIFSKKMFHQLLGKSLLNNCFFHATAASEQQALSLLVNPIRFFNIPNFIQLPPYIKEDSSPDNDCIKLLFLSRIEEKKGLDILLNALSGINIPYQLNIVGDGDELYIDSLKQLAQKNGVAKHVNWLGFQHANKFDLFKQHDLFILPSYDENFGNVVIESLSMGTAVLLSKNVGLASYVSDNDFGWVYDLNELSLTKAINNSALQKDKLTIIRQKAPLQVRADFNEDKLTHEYLAMYDQILKHG